jgi:hypothetical protein
MYKTRAGLIRGYFAAYQAKDRATIEGALADGFKFTSPYDDAIDKATYFERCWPNSAKQHDIAVERVFEDGDAAFVTYSFRKDNGERVRNTEYFTFSGDRVATVDVYFGAVHKDGKLVKATS